MVDLQNFRSRFGQSLWLDNLSRTLIHDGLLARHITEDGITGVTSNPSIFQKAIHESPYYQQDLRQPAQSAERLYEELVKVDLQMACDLLAPIHAQTNGDDGWVSWEESPELAQDTDATIAEAERLRGMVARENLLIKVPATEAGIRALRVLIAKGISINVTLIFGLAQLRQVFQAYQDGLAQWVRQGGDAKQVKAVASLFLSRVDTLVDQKLSQVGSSEALALRGKTAVAMAKRAYVLYQEMFHGQAFADLAAQGARPQYLLWASTSTKNPAYSDLLYVEPLIGPETINTLPDETLSKLKDHGRLAAGLTQGMSEAAETLSQVQGFGIDLDGEIAPTLQTQGLQAFADAFHAMLAEVERFRA